MGRGRASVCRRRESANEGNAGSKLPAPHLPYCLPYHLAPITCSPTTAFNITVMVGMDLKELPNIYNLFLYRIYLFRYHLKFRVVLDSVNYGELCTVKGYLLNLAWNASLLFWFCIVLFCFYIYIPVNLLLVKGVVRTALMDGTPSLS